MSSMMTKWLAILFLCASGYSLGVVARANGDQPPTVSAPAPALRHTTQLKFIDGSYTSVFGLVPKKCQLSSDDKRVIVERAGSDSSSFTLEMLSSDVWRILSVPDENPTVSTTPKPLTGKTIRVVKKGDKWAPEILATAEPTEEEEREAERLVVRFSPGSSPFRELVWNTEGVSSLDLAVLLRFLGYTHAKDVHGSATLSRVQDESPEKPSLRIEAAFESGEGIDRILVELNGKGSVLLSGVSPHYRKVQLDGDLSIHGHRVLPDGRKVPYSLITSFSYETSVSPEPAP